MKNSPLFLMVTSCFSLCMPLLQAEDNTERDSSLGSPLETVHAIKETSVQEEERARAPTLTEGYTAPPKPEPHPQPQPIPPKPHPSPTPQQPTPHTAPKNKSVPQHQPSPSVPSSKIPKQPQSRGNKSLTTQHKQIAENQIPPHGSRESVDGSNIDSLESNHAITQEENSQEAVSVHKRSETKDLELLDKPFVHPTAPPSQLRPSPRPAPLIVNSYGELQNQDNTTTEMVDCCEPTPVCCPPIMPLCPDPCCVYPEKWLIGVEFLYWKINKGNTYYAIKRQNQSPYITNQISANLLGELKRPQMDFSPGVRGSIGYRFGRDAWELSADYTYYAAHKNNTVSVEFPPVPGGIGVDQQILTPNVIVPAFDIVLHGYANTATSKIKFKYMIENLRLARVFPLSRYIDLRLFFGLQGAQISQKWHVNFAYLGDVAEPFVSTIVDKNTLNWSFQGAGGNLGFDTNWHIGCGFGLLAQASFSALYGVHKTKIIDESNESSFDSLPDATTYISKSNPVDHRPIYGTQFAFGVSWEREFSCVDLKLSASYESISWQNLNGDIFTQSYPLTLGSGVFVGPNEQHAPIINDTPFNLSGLTVKLALEF